MNKKQLIEDIKLDIKKQRDIYNSESSTVEQQQKAYNKKIMLQKELAELEKQQNTNLIKGE